MTFAAGCLWAADPATPEGVRPDLDQGWSAQQREAWYDASLGSRLLPLSWILAIEQADSDQLFFSEANAAKLGFPLRAWQNSDLRLPRGFAVDKQSDLLLSDTHLRWKDHQSPSEPWVGLNCAGCHSLDIHYRGTRFTVDGGSTLAHIMPIFNGLHRALEQTVGDPAKFDRFAGRVLGSEDNDKNRSLLQSALKQRDQFLAKLLDLSKTDLVAGPGRMDATDLVLNRVAINSQTHDLIANPVDAPTSIPALWHTMQLDKMQSNGFSPNLRSPEIHGKTIDLGYLASDIAVIQGAFGDVVTRPALVAGLMGGYRSSIRVANLLRVEDLVHSLRPPAWPSAIFGPPNASLAAAGKTLYEQKCAACHAPLDRRDLSTPVTARRVPLKSYFGQPPIGTDPWMACNVYTHRSGSGNYFGLPIIPLGTPSKLGLIGPSGKIADMQVPAVLAVMAGRALEIGQGFAEYLASLLTGKSALPSSDNGAPSYAWPFTADTASAQSTQAAQARLDSHLKEQRKQYCLSANSDFLGYIARPLNGIWSTAPYLHNGSVPTLYDLLLPAEQRPSKFYIGNGEFDPIKVGYQTAASDQDSFLLDTSLEGNSNAGHDFGRDLTETQRRALLEYLKTL